MGVSGLIRTAGFRACVSQVLLWLAFGVLCCVVSFDDVAAVSRLQLFCVGQVPTQTPFKIGFGGFVA